MRWNTVVYWFRNDLRLMDNEGLFAAHQASKYMVPVFCIDPDQWEDSMISLARTGKRRSTFLWDTLQKLDQDLRSLGSRLLICFGKAEIVIPSIVKQFQAQAVFGHFEVGTEEAATESQLETALFSLGIPLELYWGNTLYHIEDLPMPVKYLPEVFTHFRRELEKEANIRKLIPRPERIHSPVELKSVDFIIPDWFKKLIEADSSTPADIHFEAGEEAAKERLKTYFWQQDLLRRYKKTRNGLLGMDYSSKFSPYLALGAISPRYIYSEVKRYEKEREKNDSTYWLIFELIWRDFFKFIARKHGEKIFLKEGIKQITKPFPFNQKRWMAWSEGKTGIPFIDAAIRELLATGYMSNRSRQNVASFLVHDLQIDWRMGAYFFEHHLLDYDVASNWGNWNYIAGIGNDPRDRYFNILSQANRYDPKGAYVKKWIPALNSLPNSLIHAPWEDPIAALRHGVDLSKVYTKPIINYGSNFVSI